ncbi:hypothetical protein BDV38DRAFT_70313 [Aspergillus pseudotamarii]|uniref:Uncharacterized protein n=1 Tax=Aspergillus pseudotamarii TaxID=132259 RepID=A0A5N6SX27_ASPPS|nr:uncharacterized protein BDV38DRAFT_70313 [Aspergillus pseudotamarii]KAE8138359.1 hypothetical protein BDV38DRAFT_70313 [Aspergillus pseudotamarii]
MTWTNCSPRRLNQKTADQSIHSLIVEPPNQHQKEAGIRVWVCVSQRGALFLLLHSLSPKFFFFFGLSPLGSWICFVSLPYTTHTHALKSVSLAPSLLRSVPYSLHLLCPSPVYPPSNLVS